MTKEQLEEALDRLDERLELELMANSVISEKINALKAKLEDLEAIWKKN